MTHCPGTTSGLCAYTARAYDELNRAVRKGRASYKASFEFHALHFLLSDAIRLLKVNQRNCYTTYRISKLLFSGESGQTMHFGSFASSSLTEDLRHFGRRTCFEIHTFRCLPQIQLRVWRRRGWSTDSSVWDVQYYLCGHVREWFTLWGCLQAWDCWVLQQSQLPGCAPFLVYSFNYYYISIVTDIRSAASTSWHVTFRCLVFIKNDFFF